MRYRKLGHSGIDASVVAFGAWAIGGWNWGGTDEKESIRAIHAAIDAGINFIDTAAIYGFVRSEEIVGKALRDRRDQVVLATKCGMRWDKKKGDFAFRTTEKETNESGDRKVYKYLGPESVREEIEKSLSRLQTDYIDLYQTHWQESTTPISETMATLMDLKKEGKIRAIGCSNATPEQMDAYRAAGQLDSDQEKFSMLDQDLKDENLTYCAGHDLALLAYSPLAQGLLTGKVDPKRRFKKGDQRRDAKRFSKENRLKVQKLLDAIKPIAETHDLTFAQLTIAWTVEQVGCSHALVGARNEKQAIENAQGGGVVLNPEEIHKIDAAIKDHAAGIPG